MNNEIQDMLKRFGVEDCRQGSRSVGHGGVDTGDWEDYIEVPVHTLEKMRTALGVITDQPVAAVTINDAPEVSDEIIQAIQAYGDAREDADPTGDELTRCVVLIRGALAQRAAPVAAVTMSNEDALGPEPGLRQDLGEALSDELYNMQQVEIEQAQEDAWIDWTDSANTARLLDRIMPLIAQRAGPGGDVVDFIESKVLSLHRQKGRWHLLLNDSSKPDIEGVTPAQVLQAVMGGETS